MDIETLKKCKENEPAFCTVECPFNLDVCTLIEKIQRGNFKAAYRLYQSAVAFPIIVSTICGEYCKEVCPRRGKDASIEMRKIEQAVVQNIENRLPQKYNVPKKGKKIAVIGAGISGLSCALKLCIKKYEVVVFEKSSVCGGHLWDIIPEDVFMEDIRTQFSFDEPQIVYNTEIRGMTDSKLLGFDAVYIATGKGNHFFDDNDITDENRLTTNRNGFFSGGSIKGVNTINAVVHGINAAVEIEKYLLTGIMPNAHEQLSTKLCTRDLDEIEYVLPCKEKIYSKEQAMGEANRCLKCSCDACKKQCDLIQFYNKSPLKIMDEVRGTTELKSVVSDITVATKMISSCNQCGACSEACPENISFQDLFLQARRALFQKGKLPWAFNDFFIRDMINAHELMSFFSPPIDKKPIKYLFFPGCQLGASDPLYVLKSYEAILKYEPASALLVDCCGAPSIWAGIETEDNKAYKSFLEFWKSINKPVVIFACARCMKILNEYVTDIEGVMLYDLFEEWDISVIKEFSGTQFALFDPCSIGKNRSIHDSVKHIAQKAGIIVDDSDNKGNSISCCGYGGNTSIVNPEYTEQVTRKRISESELPYITYCSNCRDVFAHKGKEAIHILDIIFDLNDINRKAPFLSDRRRNRKTLNEEISMIYSNGNEKTKNSVESVGKPIVFSEEVKTKLDLEYILEEEVEQVVRYCEENCKKMVSAEGNFIGHLKIGYMTYWVEYDAKSDYYYIVNAYSHRMYIKEEQ